MSEERFKEAKGELANSQRVVDEFRMSQMPQEEVAQEEQTEIPMEGNEEATEEQGVVEQVVGAVKPMFEELKSLFTKKEDEPKEVEIKIEGEMKPKEETLEEPKEE